MSTTRKDRPVVERKGSTRRPAPPALGDRGIKDPLGAKTARRAPRSYRNSCLAVGADPVDEDAWIELFPWLPLAAFTDCAKPKLVLPALAVSGTLLSRRQHVQNGPVRASDCPPPKLVSRRV